MPDLRRFLTPVPFVRPLGYQLDGSYVACEYCGCPMPPPPRRPSDWEPVTYPPGTLFHYSECPIYAAGVGA